MEKTISFGKVEAPGYGKNGRKDCEITIEVALKDGELSISGSLWAPSKRDILMGGQCLNSLLEFIPENEKMQRIVKVWKRWHLNKMNPGCEHQRGEELEKQLARKVKKYHFTLEGINSAKQRAIKELSLKKLEQGETVTLTDEEKNVLAMPYEKTILIFEEEAPPEAPEGYKFNTLGMRGNPEVTSLNWLKQSEHPQGMLSRPCDVCGYKYGTAWLTEELPEEIINEVNSW